MTGLDAPGCSVWSHRAGRPMLITVFGSGLWTDVQPGKLGNALTCPINLKYV